MKKDEIVKPEAPLKVALIGAGARSGKQYCPLFKFIKPWVEVVAVCDPVKEHCDLVAEMLEVKGYYNIYELVADNPMEAAIIVIPIPSHHSISVFLSSNGIHNLCETTWCSMVMQARDMIQKAHENNVVVRVAENFFRFSIDRFAQTVRDSGYIGKIRRIFSYADHTGYHNDSRWIALFALLWGITRAQRGHMMPHQMEGFKLASVVRMNSRKLWGAMILSVVIGALTSFWLMLDISYQVGALAPRWGREAFRRLEQWFTYLSGSDVTASSFMAFGFCLTIIFMLMKVRFRPLHPVAYPLATSFTLNTGLWFSIFLSWLAKWLILKHRGIKAYRQAFPFFIGLIFGEFIIGGLWSIIGIIFEIPVYRFWH